MEGVPVRFIPACAGNAYKQEAKRLNQPVHPRMRGERWNGSRIRFTTCGSSPHARGTPMSRRRKTPLVTVHPRMRGERTAAQTYSLSAIGSSPHARGTHFQ